MGRVSMVAFWGFVLALVGIADAAVGAAVQDGVGALSVRQSGDTIEDWSLLATIQDAQADLPENIDLDEDFNLGVLSRTFATFRLFYAGNGEELYSIDAGSLGFQSGRSFSLNGEIVVLAFRYFNDQEHPMMVIDQQNRQYQAFFSDPPGRRFDLVRVYPKKEARKLFFVIELFYNETEAGSGLISDPLMVLYSYGLNEGAPPTLTRVSEYAMDFVGLRAAGFDNSVGEWFPGSPDRAVITWRWSELLEVVEVTEDNQIVLIKQINQGIRTNIMDISPSMNRFTVRTVGNDFRTYSMETLEEVAQLDNQDACGFINDFTMDTEDSIILVQRLVLAGDCSEIEQWTITGQKVWQGIFDLQPFSGFRISSRIASNGATIVAIAYDEVINEENRQSIKTYIWGDDGTFPRSPDSTATQGPTATPEPSDDGVCFPASAQVVLESGVSRRMDELEVGDKVAVGGGKYSEVMFFGHRTMDRDVVHKYVTLDWMQESSGLSGSVSLTPQHFIHSSGSLKRASAVRVGDTLLLSTLRGDVEVHVERVSTDSRALGLFNPHTVEGEIVVDGVLASCYTDVVHPKLAHALLLPVRLAFKYLRVNLLGTAFESDIPSVLYTIAAFAHSVSLK